MLVVGAAGEVGEVVAGAAVVAGVEQFMGHFSVVMGL